MSEKTVFISYRRDSAGNYFARSIKEALTQRGYDVFLDVDCIDAGEWAAQILTQVPKKSHFLILLTAGALDRCVQPDDWVLKEYLAASASKRNIVPILEGLVDLDTLKAGCVEAMKGLFAYQVVAIQNSSFARDIDTLVERYIAAHKAPDPYIALSPRSTGISVGFDISRIGKYTPDELIGRERELKLLNDAWAKVQAREPKRTHIMTFVALGGEGKTSLVAKWVADLAHQDWPGCEAAFAWSFYSQGAREQAGVSSDAFLAAALAFFGDAAMAESATGAFDKGRRLAQLVGERRALVILDGLEPLQYPPGPPLDGKLKDHGLAEFLKGLASINRGLCIVTTRYRIPDLRVYWRTTAPMHDLLRLPTVAGLALLRALGVTTGSQADFERLVEDVDGHALTLQIIGQFLVRVHHGDVRRRDRIDIQKADARIQGGHAFRAMAAYVNWMETDSDRSRRELAILSLMGLFDRPANADCVAALRRPPSIPGLTEPLLGLAEDDWEFSLSTLRDAKLLTVNRAEGSGEVSAIDAHPLLRDYFARRIREEQPEAGRAAHRRLYEHLCESTREGNEPSLEDLQPLYQAVAHGCQAGLQQEACDDVYYARILRGEEHYSWHRLGAYGSEVSAQAWFFDLPWSRVCSSLTASDQAWILNEAAFCLRSLGRLTEALQPVRTGLENYVAQEDWSSAAITAENLSGLELTLGEVALAVQDGERSVVFADRAGARRRGHRAAHADALHQMGRRTEAESRFREAEAMQSDGQSGITLLHAVPGFKYCELLLSTLEQAVGRAMLSESRTGSVEPESLNVCRAVSGRVAQTLKWAEQQRVPLGIGLDHLSLARVALYEAVLEPSDLGRARSEIQQALTSLRIAGQQDEIPRGLLTRAVLLSLEGASTGAESAQSDLDEAWEIAERGSMKLFMADIHLYRARLFFREANYPWTSPAEDLRAAEKLVNDCGYHRRDEELADAKKAILG